MVVPRLCNNLTSFKVSHVHYLHTVYKHNDTEKATEREHRFVHISHGRTSLNLPYTNPPPLTERVYQKLLNEAHVN
jgi:hypothetical protein